LANLANALEEYWPAFNKLIGSFPGMFLMPMDGGDHLN